MENTQLVFEILLGVGALALMFLLRRPKENYDDTKRFHLMEKAGLQLDAHLRRDGSLAWTHPTFSVHLALKNEVPKPKDDESAGNSIPQTCYAVEFSQPLSWQLGPLFSPDFRQEPMLENESFTDLRHILEAIDESWSPALLKIKVEGDFLRVQKEGWPPDVATLSSFKRRCDSLVPVLQMFPPNLE
ncbi:MAG: hypothetical protein GY822_04075 [Deltaproteobacteria bacterium]|nr:hypothetical protein [Deltaproteobacteria bacterium]